MCTELGIYPRKESPGEREALKNALDRNEADSVGHSMGKKGERPREKEVQ